MGFLDDLQKPVGLSSILPVITSSAKRNLEWLNYELGNLDQAMYVLEYTPGFSNYHYKINEFRGKISNIQQAISKPLDYLNTYEDCKSLLYSIRRIQSLDPYADPVTVAKAYGATMSSLGKLIQKLPPPADAVGVLVDEMGRIFAQIVKNVIPSAHFHDWGNNPGITELVENL